MSPEEMARQFAKTAAQSLGVNLSEEDIQTLFRRVIVRNALYQIEARVLPPLVAAGAGAVVALLFSLPVLSTMVAALAIRVALGVTTESLARDIPDRGGRFMRNEIERLGSLRKEEDK